MANVQGSARSWSNTQRVALVEELVEKAGIGVQDRIVAAEVLVTSPGRNYVTLKITTAEGLTGWGDATLNGRELAVAAYLRDHVCPLLIGRDPARIEDTWQYLYRGVYWRRGPVTMTSVGAVDLALWDVKAVPTREDPRCARPS